jgi:hypothetical protein
MIDTTYDKNSDYAKEKREKRKVVNLLPENNTPAAPPSPGKVTLRYSNSEPLFAVSLDSRKRASSSFGLLVTEARNGRIAVLLAEEYSNDTTENMALQKVPASQ